MSKDLKKKSQLAWGACLICVFFALEAWNANRVHPSAATPLIWALLGFFAVVSAAFGVALGHRARRAGVVESRDGNPGA